MIDFTTYLGEPFKMVTYQALDSTGKVVTLTKEVINVEFLANFAFIMFMFIFLSNLIIRTCFSRRG